MLSFLRGNFRWIAGGFLLTYTSSFGQTFFISASVAEWQSAFDLSHGEFGRLYMLATLASAASLPFLGRLVDVVPEHRMIVITAPLLAVGTVIAAFAPSVIVLGVGLYMLRLFGQGMMTQIALTATGRWFAAQRGRAVSLVVLGHQGGEATLPLLFGAVTLVLGYQFGWLAGTAFILLIALPLGAVAFAKPRQPKGHAPATPDAAHARQWTRGEVLTDPLFWILLTGVLAPAFIGTTIFFHQDYLTTLNTWPENAFAQSFTVMAVTTVVSALINGALIDRYSAKAILPVFLLPLAVACFAAGASGPVWTLFAFMVLLGFSYGVSSTLFGALWPEVYGTTHLGAIRAVIVSAMVLATAAGPGLTGTLIDAGLDLPRQITVMGVYCVLISGVLTLITPRLRARAHPLAAS